MRSLLSTWRARLMVAFALALAPAACAPRHSHTNYDRWAQDNAKRHDAERAKGSGKKTAKASAGGSATGGSKSTPVGGGDSSYSSLPGGTRTATKARAVKPEPEDDAIY